jgi:large conductance mechanosensitive channel
MEEVRSGAVARDVARASAGSRCGRRAGSQTTRHDASDRRAPAPARQGGTAVLKGFRAFLVQSNALALAIGVIIGAALGAVVNSLVKDIIMPPIGLVLGGVDFGQLKWILKDTGDPATTVSINYGTFINAIITFVVIAFVVWRISITFIRDAPPEEIKTCPLQGAERDRRLEVQGLHQRHLNGCRSRERSGDQASSLG